MIPIVTAFKYKFRGRGRQTKLKLQSEDRVGESQVVWCYKLKTAQSIPKYMENSNEAGLFCLIINLALLHKNNIVA